MIIVRNCRSLSRQVRYSRTTITTGRSEQAVTEPGRGRRRLPGVRRSTPTVAHAGAISADRPVAGDGEPPRRRCTVSGHPDPRPGQDGGIGHRPAGQHPQRGAGRGSGWPEAVHRRRGGSPSPATGRSALIAPACATVGVDRRTPGKRRRPRPGSVTACSLRPVVIVVREYRTCRLKLRQLRTMIMQAKLGRVHQGPTPSPTVEPTGNVAPAGTSCRQTRPRSRSSVTGQPAPSAQDGTTSTAARSPTVASACSAPARSLPSRSGNVASTPDRAATVSVTVLPASTAAPDDGSCPTTVPAG